MKTRGAEHLECGWCGKTYPSEELQRLSPCCERPLLARYDLDALRGSFTLAATADTFLDLRNWPKGTIWINGHHLGRFWNIGPQQTLYVPGPWLRRGANEVVVFSLVPPSTVTLAGLASPILNDLREKR